MPAPGLFIAATDTGMGKTHVGQTIVRTLTETGWRIGVLKPAESGCLPDRHGLPLPADAHALWRAAGEHQPLDAVCPFRFRAALAPPEAARAEGRTLRLDALLHACRPALARHVFTLIEGAGGLHSPIAEDALNIDLALALDLPILLVAPDRLGTQSATLAAAESIHRRGGQLRAVLLNRRPEDQNDHGDDNANEQTAIQRPDNAGALRQWLPRLCDGPVEVYRFEGDVEARPDWPHACRRWATNKGKNEAEHV